MTPFWLEHLWGHSGKLFGRWENNFGRLENYFGRWENYFDCEEFFLTDWSPPDDPAYDYDDYAGDFVDDDKNMILATITT